MQPILCNYYLTYRCNCCCQFCEIWCDPRYQNIPDADVEIVKKNLAQLKKIGVRFVDFTGGEPLLYEPLPEILYFARKAGLYTSITTNGYFYAKRAAEIRQLVNFLHFSLDSFDPEEHDRLRGKDVFSKVMRSIMIAKQLGERPDILFTVTEKNYQQIEPLAQFCQAHRLILIVNPVFSYGNSADLELTLLDYLDKFRRKPYIYINRAFHLFRRDGGNRIEEPRCRAMSSTIVISPDNKVLAPCFHYHTAQFPIEPDLNAVLQSSAYQKLKSQEGRFPFCQGCTMNCYFDPSFTQKIDKYWWLSQCSKLKYAVDKYVRALFLS